jgi:uncharacterized tellurite resistance protein B-like protein
MIGSAVINRIKALLKAGEAGAPSVGSDVDERQVAAAALLVEAARMDDDFDEAERRKIVELVTDRFELSGEEGETLLQIAESRVEDSVQTFGFTRVVKESFSHEERIELMEMLWQVVYVDGKLHDLEASLMRRIAGLVFVTDRESAAARKRALKRLKA